MFRNVSWTAFHIVNISKMMALQKTFHLHISANPKILCMRGHQILLICVEKYCVCNWYLSWFPRLAFFHMRFQVECVLTLQLAKFAGGWSLCDSLEKYMNLNIDILKVVWLHTQTCSSCEMKYLLREQFGTCQQVLIQIVVVSKLFVTMFTLCTLVISIGCSCFLKHLCYVSKSLSKCCHKPFYHATVAFVESLMKMDDTVVWLHTQTYLSSEMKYLLRALLGTCQQVLIQVVVISKTLVTVFTQKIWVVSIRRGCFLKHMYPVSQSLSKYHCKLIYPANVAFES